MITFFIQSNYAETLHSLYLIKSGMIFTIVYNMIKNFISERTRSKFKFASGSEYLDILRQNIELDQIPRDYGGTGSYLDEIEI